MELKLCAIVRRTLDDLLRRVLAVSRSWSPVNTKPDRPRSENPGSAGDVGVALTGGHDMVELRTGIEL